MWIICRQLVRRGHRFNHRFPCWVPWGSEFHAIFRHRTKSERCWVAATIWESVYTLLLAVGIHQFLELGGILDFEENFLTVLHLTLKLPGSSLSDSDARSVLVLRFQPFIFIITTNTQITLYIPPHNNELTSSACPNLLGIWYLPCWYSIGFFSCSWFLIFSTFLPSPYRPFSSSIRR